MSAPEALSDLRPGDAILLGDLSQMPVFEDAVALAIDPEMSDEMHQAWLGRVPLRDLVKPPTFNGSMRDIALIVMDEPYERLHDARDRGRRFKRAHPFPGYTGTQGGGVPGRRSTDQAYIESYRGFIFTADAISTGRGVIGQIQAEMWYSGLPISKGENKASVSTRYGGRSVQRLVSVAEYEIEDFIRVQEEAKKIGYEVLRKHLWQVRSNPHRG